MNKAYLDSFEFGKCQYSVKEKCEFPDCNCHYQKADTKCFGVDVDEEELRQPTLKRQLLQPVSATIVIAALKQMSFDWYTNNEISYRIYSHQTARLNRIQNDIHDRKSKCKCGGNCKCSNDE